MKLENLKKLKAFVINTSFLKLISFGIVLMIVFKHFSSSNIQNQVKQAVLPIAMKIPVSNYVPNVKVSGLLIPGNTGVIKANFKALVSKVFIKKGREVKKGEIILELKNDEIEKRLVEAKARYVHKHAEQEAYQKLAKKSYTSPNDYLAIVADLEQAKTNLQKAEIDASELIVRALDNGYLEECYVHEGDTIFAEDKLVNVIYPEATYVRSYVSEEIIEKLSIGMDVRVNIANKEYNGVIYGLSKVADPVTRSFYVDTTIGNLSSVNYGATAEVTFMLPSRHGFFINASALTLDDKGVLGVKALNDSSVIFLPVQLNAMTEQGAYVECDCKELSLIVYGGEFLLPGQTPEVSWQKTPSL